MTKNDFFVFLLKGIGFFALSSYVLNNLAFLFSLSQQDLMLVVVQLAVILIYIGIILNASKIVSFLNLAKDIETEFISFNNVSGSELVKLGLLIVGTYLLINNVTDVLVHLAAVLIEKTQNQFGSADMSYYTSYPNLIQSSIKSIVGLVVVTQSKGIANLLHTDKT
jgi:hypothetical protein